MKINHIQILYALVAIAILFAGVAVYVSQNQSQAIYSIDVKQINQDFNNLMAKSPLSESVKNQKAFAFAQQLTASIERLSSEHNAIILVSPAVISGVVNLTPNIKRSVFESVGVQR